MNKTIISSGDKVVLSSGVVTSFENNPISIEIYDENDSMIKLQFIFVSDETVKKHSMSTAVVEDVLCLTLTNFDSPLGIGTKKPIYFAQYGDELLYLLFRVSAIDAYTRTLYYTVYTDGGKNNGTK